VATPCAFFLSLSKTESDYAYFFESVRREIPSWKPTLVITDFETALMEAAEKETGAQGSGCYFHLVQSLYRWLQKNASPIGGPNGPVATQLLHSAELAALAPSMPLHQVLYEQLLAQAEMKFAAFGTYFQKTWGCWDRHVSSLRSPS